MPGFRGHRHRRYACPAQLAGRSLDPARGYGCVAVERAGAPDTVFVLARCLAAAGLTVPCRRHITVAQTMRYSIWREICWSGLTPPALSPKIVLDALDAAGMSAEQVTGHRGLGLILSTLRMELASSETLT